MNATPTGPPGAPGSAVVLFDGTCNFCNDSVNFLLRRDARAHLRFAALGSEAGQALLRRHGLAGIAPDTMAFIADGRAYTKSSAAIRAVSALGGVWRCFAAALIVPRALRDLAYDVFAANRYRLFGRASACAVPKPEYRERFLG